MQTKTTMTYHFTHTVMITTRVKLTSAGDMEKLEPSYTARGKGKTVLENSLLVPQKIKYRVNMRVCVHLFQSCPTLCDPMDCSPPGSSVHGILQASGLPWPPQGIFPTQRLNPRLLHRQVDSLLLSHQRSPKMWDLSI